MLTVGQSLVYYIYAAGYFLSAELIIEEKTSYDRAFRSVQLLPLLKNDAVLYCMCVMTLMYMYFLCRVFSTVHFTALSISQVGSIAPDLTKAKISAFRILTLLKRKPQIDASCNDGFRLVTTS